MAAHTIRGSFQALRKKVKGTFSSEQMDAITNVEQFAESKVQIAESKVQITEEQKRSARKEVKLLEEKAKLLEEVNAFMAKDYRNLLLILARYRVVLENRALLERNAEVLYKTESLTSTNGQVKKLINEQCIDKKNGKLSECAEDIRQKLEDAGYVSAAYRKSIVDQMRGGDAYRIISTPAHQPELLGGFTGWAVGGNGKGALVAVICTIISLDSAYDQLGATAPREILILNDRHEHIMTWTRRAGLQRLPRPESLQSKLIPDPPVRPDMQKLMKMSKADLQAQLKDARLPTTGIKTTLVKRLLGEEA